jgi:serine/threonine protein phosphatase 1
MAFTYAIADLHGRFDLLKLAYVEIQYHAKEPGTVVHLGDYVDRGPESRQVIEGLKKPFWKGWKRIVLKGNHEDIMWQTCRQLPHAGRWMENGGAATLISYGQKEGEWADVKVVPDHHLDWIAGLPLMHIDKHRVYVHAGVDPDIPLDAQDPQTLMWKIYKGADQRGHGDRHVVHGHHQFKDGPMVVRSRTNLDTRAWYTGRLAVGIVDDDRPGGAVMFLEVRGEPAGRGG